MYWTVLTAAFLRAVRRVRPRGRSLFVKTTLGEWTRPRLWFWLLCMGLVLTPVLPLKAFVEPSPASANQAQDWCAEHEVPESKCTLCNPALIPGFQAVNDWCAGHELPESICPKCSHGAPAPPAIHADDWCSEHQVPESRCTLCHEELVPGFKAMGDWCSEHRLPESVCPDCNGGPLLAQTQTASETQHSAGQADDWCAGHMVPESKCTLCNPELITSFQDSGDWCAEHRLPESVCPQCKPPSVDQIPVEQRIVRFLNPAKEAQAGIEVIPVRRGDVDAAIEAPARLAFNADRVAEVRAVVEGNVQAIYASQGDAVEGGAPLFDLVSPEVGEIQANLRAAKTKVRVAEIQLKRQQKLAERRIVGTWEVEQAELDVETARAELAAAETTLGTVGADPDGVPGRFTVYAPLTGTLVRRDAVLGSHAGHAQVLGTIADTAHLWVLSDVAERDAARLQLGAPLRFQSDDGQIAEGRIQWIDAQVDAATRTVTVRADIQNPTGSLRAQQFGRAHITLPQTGGAWLVPKAAVQRIDNRDVVFVRREQGVYQPREVQRLGEGDWLPVRARLSAGDQVVTTGAVLLLTEMLPGSIGAGCCEVEPLGQSNGGG